MRCWCGYLERGADCLHVVQLMPLHPKTSSSLASLKSRLVSPFCYQLTQVVLNKRPLNGCNSSSTSTYYSTDLLTARGVTHLVVHGTSGSTSYETIPPVRLESSGGVLSTVDMVVQRRDGPRRLRDHDDD